MAAFADSIKANIKQLEQEINDKIISIASYGFREIVNESPSESIGSEYAQGWLKNQWYVSFDSPSSNMTTKTDQSGANSIAQINSLSTSTKFFKKDGSLFFTNNVPHGYRTEVLGWYPDAQHPMWQGTAPYAMMAKGLVRMKAKT